MGVPAFFRWLTKKYPEVIIDCIEDRPPVVNGKQVPVDTTKPNPNGVTFDNFYLDMNGIIHPCTHPEDKPAPETEDDMMVAIFECIDRLFGIVRPRKLIYMAIDGVAPRAKMNQQRSRRFRASKEATEKLDLMDRVRVDIKDKGGFLPPAKEKGAHFDTNCITPGTPFMARLSQCLQYYIQMRLNTDPGWRDLVVILSDANVPGEGEHKIMDFIRRQRAQPDHNPNTHHVLCGADADLIMLGLATHEAHFTIIREEFKPNKPKPCDLCKKLGHELKDCCGVDANSINNVANIDDEKKEFGSEVQYIFVRLSVLREYLYNELRMDDLPFKFDFERALDDWVFMCFFVGNDFLPHLPSLEIRENAIDKLVNFYKFAVRHTKGYLTESGIVNPDRVQIIMRELSKVEDEIFQNRRRKDLSFKQYNKRMKFQNGGARGGRGGRGGSRSVSRDGPRFVPQSGDFAPVALGKSNEKHMMPAHDVRNQGINMRKQGMQVDKNIADLNEKLSNRDSRMSQFQKGRGGGGGKRKSDSELTATESDGEESEDNDEVKLYEDGYMGRYYESKFGVIEDDTQIEFRKMVAREYTLGMCWVLRYYYQGCSSWKWYFPFHYAPFAADFLDVHTVKNEFESNTQPFQPLQQLMGVFPAASRSHVPDPYAAMMIDPDGPIIDFYPTDFNIDLNGKKYAWQGVALLPFVDEKRLKEALSPLESKLKRDEVERNTKGQDLLYVHKSHEGFRFLSSVVQGGSDLDVNENFDVEYSKLTPIEMEASQFKGMRGQVLPSVVNLKKGEEVDFGAEMDVKSPVAGLEDIITNSTVCVAYRNVQYSDDFIFPSVRLDVKEPPSVLNKLVGGGSNTSGWFGGGEGDNSNGTYYARKKTRGGVNDAGHRMLNRHVDNAFNNQGSFWGEGGKGRATMSDSQRKRINDQGGGDYRQQSHYGGGGGQQNFSRGDSRGGGSYQDRRRGGAHNNRGSHHQENHQGYQPQRGGGRGSYTPQPQQPYHNDHRSCDMSHSSFNNNRGRGGPYQRGQHDSRGGGRGGGSYTHGGGHSDVSSRGRRGDSFFSSHDASSRGGGRGGGSHNQHGQHQSSLGGGEAPNHLTRGDHQSHRGGVVANRGGGVWNVQPPQNFMCAPPPGFQNRLGGDKVNHSTSPGSGSAPSHPTNSWEMGPPPGFRGHTVTGGSEANGPPTSAPNRGYYTSGARR